MGTTESETTSDDTGTGDAGSPAPPRRSPRVLLAAGATLLAVVAIGIASTRGTDDGDDEASGTSPTTTEPLVVEPGLPLQLWNPASETAGLTEKPADAVFRGVTAGVEIERYGFPDRVEVVASDGGPSAPLAPPAGYRWLVLDADFLSGVYGDGSLLDALGRESGVPQTRIELVADEALIMAEWPYRLVAGPWALLFPEDAASLELVIGDGDDRHGFSFLTGKPTGAPSRLAVGRVRQTVPQVVTLPFTSDPPPEPDHPMSLDLTVDEAEVFHAALIQTTSGRWSAHLPSGPDRALLMLDIETEWGGLPPTTDYLRYELRPEDLVLTLEDGTTIAATAPPENSRFCRIIYEPRCQAPDGEPLLGYSPGLTPGDAMGPNVVFDVPADLTEATITIRPTNDRGLDFGGGSVSFEVAFPPG